MASASTVSEPKLLVQRRKSNDTVCSSNSSCLLHKRKSIHPLANSIRTYVSNSPVKQRVLSARLLKLRSLQNQLNDANFHLVELQQENRALRNLQTRQDKALSKYEGTNADLPKLLKSHEEEIRILVAKNKTLRKTLKDVSDQLKTKEEELANVREQLKNLVSLTKQKNLGERHALAEQVEDLKAKLQSSDEKINLLNRKIQLETKNYRYKLNGEIAKNKQSQKELLHALAEIDRLNSLLEVKGKVVFSSNRKRFTNVNQRQSVSLTMLSSNEKTANQDIIRDYDRTDEFKVSFDLPNTDNEADYESNHSDIKLQPISNNDKEIKNSLNDIMTPPSENIKARLSASLTSKTNIDQLNKSLEKLNIVENDLNEPSHTITIIRQKSQSNSYQKLEKLSPSMELLQTPFNNQSQAIEQSLGNLCDEMLSTVKDCGTVVDKHKEDYETAKSETAKLLESLRKTDEINLKLRHSKEDYETAKNETAKLLESLRKTDEINSKLRHSNFLSKETFEIPEKDIDLVNKIWQEEYAFRNDIKLKEYDGFVKSDRNGNVIKKDTEVAPDDKTKLLAKLRAIDNGEDIEEASYNSDIPNRKSTLADELFAELDK